MVPGEFTQAYNRFAPTLQRLQARCDLLLGGVAREVGSRFTGSRIKKVESLLLKTEKDGPGDPFKDSEDLYAATIVVPNETLIPALEEQIKAICEVKDRRAQRTRRPEEFIYDDLHFILQLKPEPGRPDPELDNIRFELQVKTEMQAASSAISHDLVYKPSLLSWTKARFASRVRALVETVDDLLARIAVEPDPDPEQSPDTNRLFAERNNIVVELRKRFPESQLPEDKRRLAVVIEQFMKECGPSPVTINDLKSMLAKEEHRSIVEATSLSVPQKIFIILVRESSLLLTRGDPSTLRGQRRYLVTSEMIDLCPELKSIPGSRKVRIES